MADVVRLYHGSDTVFGPYLMGLSRSIFHLASDREINSVQVEYSAE